MLKQLDSDGVTADLLPVLIKAQVGGGGRGMWVVRELTDLTPQIEATQREAASAFGDPTVFCGQPDCDALAWPTPVVPARFWPGYTAIVTVDPGQAPRGGECRYCVGSVQVTGSSWTP